MSLPSSRNGRCGRSPPGTILHRPPRMVLKGRNGAAETDSMPHTVETRVARCGNCQEVVPVAGNTIRLSGINPATQVGADGEVALAPARNVSWLLVCPQCRRRTRITDLD